MKYILFCFLFMKLNALMIILEQNKEFCIYKDLLSNDILKLSFMVSGSEEVEKNVSVKVFDQDKKLIYANTAKINEFLKQDSKDFEVKYKNTYSICFLSAKYPDVVISFEINTQSESGHILSLAKDGKLFYYFFI